jgi:hypothetical protein
MAAMRGRPSVAGWDEGADVTVLPGSLEKNRHLIGRALA